MIRSAFALVAMVVAACGAPIALPAGSGAAAQPSAGIEIADPWARPTPGGAQVAAGYLTIANRGATQDRLVSAASSRAGRVEVHSMSVKDGVMEMRKIETLAIPAGTVTALAPGGLHLMFFNLAGPFSAGESVPVTLQFERAGAVEAVLAVRRDAPSGGGGHASDHSGH